MWYFAQILFAQAPMKDKKRAAKDKKRVMYMCETCNILLNSDNANLAFDQAMEWGTEYLKDSLYPTRILGITGLTAIGEKRPGNGTEISGVIFKMKDVWNRKSKIIPDKKELSAIYLELNSNVPIKDLSMGNRVKRFFNSVDTINENESRRF